MTDNSDPRPDSEVRGVGSGPSRTPPLPFVPMKAILEEPEPGLYFLVRDNGPGIDEEFLPRAFDKFEKQSRSSGTGLGLYFVRLMVEAIEGSILVRTGPDGTVMALAIPLASGDTLASAKKDGSGLTVGAPNEASHRKRRRTHQERPTRPA